MDLLETTLVCHCWNTILSSFNTSSTSLQSRTIDPKVTVDLLESLVHFLDTLRESFDTFERETHVACGRSDYKVTRARSEKEMWVVMSQKELYYLVERYIVRRHTGV